MKFKDKYNISKEFEDIFSFQNEEEEIEHDAKMLVQKFLEEVEKCFETGPQIKKKDIADAIGKSRSFVSQLYSGEKLLNFIHLAQLQKSLNLNFEIKAKLNDAKYSELPSKSSIRSFMNNPDGNWVWIKNKPDYNKEDNCCNDSKASKKVNAA